jgi:hypothetical protein
MEKRCAYFGCMHPMFTPTSPTQKYCCHECTVKANNKSARAVAAHKVRDAAISADPEKRKKRSYAAAAYGYKNAMNVKKLPPWMES